MRQYSDDADLVCGNGRWVSVAREVDFCNRAYVGAARDRHSEGEGCTARRSDGCSEM